MFFSYFCVYTYWQIVCKIKKIGEMNDSQKLFINKC